MADPISRPFDVIETLVGVEDGIADFISNGPSDGLGGYVRDQYRNRCNQFANAVGWGKNLPLGPAGALGRVCGPYWDASGVDGPVVASPGTGGQCDALYTASWEARVFNQTSQAYEWSPVNPANQFPGPVAVSGGRTGGTCTNPGDTAQTFIITGDGGFPSVQLSSGCADVFPSYRNLVFSRVDGLPDDCGDPPPELQPGDNPPPDPGPTPGDEPSIDPRNPTGPPLLPVPPYIDPIGEPVPIVGQPTSGDPLTPGDFPGAIDGQIGGADAYGAPINIDPGPGGGGEDIPFGPPPAGRIWVGAGFDFSASDTYGDIPGSGPQNNVYPQVLGNASLKYASFRDEPVRVNGRFLVLVRKSPALQVQGVYVNSIPGVTYRVVPISLKVCPDNTCSEE